MTAEMPVHKRYLHRFKQCLLVLFGVLLFFGPPVYFIYRLVTYDGPLFATREVQTTTTEMYGFIPDVAGVLLLWVLFVVILWFAAYGPRVRT